LVEVLQLSEGLIRRGNGDYVSKTTTYGRGEECSRHSPRRARISSRKKKEKVARPVSTFRRRQQKKAFELRRITSGRKGETHGGEEKKKSAAEAFKGVKQLKPRS